MGRPPRTLLGHPPWESAPVLICYRVAAWEAAGRGLPRPNSRRISKEMSTEIRTPLNWYGGGVDSDVDET